MKKIVCVVLAVVMIMSTCLLAGCGDTTKLEEQLGELQTKLDEANDKADDLQADLDKTKGDKEDLQADLDEANEKIEGLTQTSDGVTVSQVGETISYYYNGDKVFDIIVSSFELGSASLSTATCTVNNYIAGKYNNHYGSIYKELNELFTATITGENDFSVDGVTTASAEGVSFEFSADLDAGEQYTLTLAYMNHQFASIIDTCAASYEVAFVTDGNGVNESQYNQTTWDGVQAWAEDNDKACKYYVPASFNAPELSDAIALAVNKGAKVVVLASFLFGDVIFSAAETYRDVDFIWLQGSGEFSKYNNIACLGYLVEQAGWLAGYAAVKDGHTILAAINGISLVSVYPTSHGFMQGADYAAKELDITIEMIYGSTGNFLATDSNKAMFSEIMARGATSIFSNGGENITSAIESAEKQDDVAIIGTGMDYASYSEVVLTSAVTKLDIALKLVLDDLYNNNGNSYFGRYTNVGLNDDAVGLAMANSRFNTFTSADYTAACEIAKNAVILISTEAEVMGATASQVTAALGLTNTTLILY